VNLGRRPTRRPRQTEPKAAGRVGSSPDFPLRLALAIVAVALALGFVLRIIDLKADPPRDLSWSSAIYSDEAHNSYSARNWELYGRCQVDDYIPYVVYPWLNLFTGIVLKIAGIGFVQLKIVSLFAGLLFIGAMYFLGRSVSRRAGAIAAVVTAFSYCFVMYSRLGLAEMTQTVFVATTIAFLARAQKSRVAAMASGASALFAILFVKVSALYLPVAALLLLFYELVRARVKRSRTGPILGQALFWLLGASIPLVVWLFAIFIPHRSTYLAYVFEHSVGAKAGHPKNIADYLLNSLSVGSWSTLYDNLPFLAGIGFALLPAFARRAGRSAVYPILILIVGVAMLGYGYYHPDRYELFTLVPIIAGFAFAIDRLLEKELRVGHPWPHIGGVLAFGLWLWPLAAQLTFRISDQRGGTIRAVIIALASGLAASLALWGLHKLTRGGIPLRGVVLRAVIAAGLLLLVLGRDIKLYADWYRTRTHLMYECSRDLDRVLPDSAVTGGFWAPAMLATSHKRALFISNQWGANLVDPVKRFGLTHVVITGAEEFTTLDSILGGRVSTAKVVRMYRINETVLVGVAELQP
jgi:4-amino-4-deoxy-L-arabinose transferase-like glycosyltransferase